MHAAAARKRTSAREQHQNGIRKGRVVQNKPEVRRPAARRQVFREQRHAAAVFDDAAAAACYAGHTAPAQLLTALPPLLWLSTAAAAAVVEAAAAACSAGLTASAQLLTGAAARRRRARLRSASSPARMVVADAATANALARCSSRCCRLLIHFSKLMKERLPVGAIGRSWRCRPQVPGGSVAGPLMTCVK